MDVHAYVTPKTNDEPEFLRQHRETLTQHHEAGRACPWHVSDATDDFITQQKKTIVAVEFRIERMEGKWKTSQNRSVADIDGVIGGLRQSTDARDHHVATLVDERRPERVNAP